MLRDDAIGETNEPLGSYTKDEWWDICIKIKPEYTREQFDKDWSEFQSMKTAHLAKQRLQ